MHALQAAKLVHAFASIAIILYAYYIAVFTMGVAQ